MSYTKHGHHIPGTSTDNAPKFKMRCGGIKLCNECKHLDPYPHEQNTNPSPLDILKQEMLNDKDNNVPLQTKTYTRKPFNIDAVQVTAENMEEVAKWCQGDIRKDDDGRSYIKVRVRMPLNENQTKAYVSDWVLYAGTGYKVYNDKAFHGSFVEKTDA